MSDAEFPAPQSGFVVTHFLVVSDQDRSREFYQSVFGAAVDGLPSDRPNRGGRGVPLPPGVLIKISCQGSDS